MLPPPPTCFLSVLTLHDPVWPQRGTCLASFQENLFLIWMVVKGEALLCCLQTGHRKARLGWRAEWGRGRGGREERASGLGTLGRAHIPLSRTSPAKKCFQKHPHLCGCLYRWSRVSESSVPLQSTTDQKYLKEDCICLEHARIVFFNSLIIFFLKKKKVAHPLH